MTDQAAEQRIALEDNSDKSAADMSDKEGQQQETAQPQEGTQPETKEGGSSWYEKPEGMGNSAGDWVQEKLNPVGKYTGKGLGLVAKPVGGIVDPLVGGVMRGGEAFGSQAGVGYGNKEGGPAKQEEAEAQRMKEPVAGEEQNAENPLGLNKKA